MITNLRYWCQKVLPLVYDDSLSYYELLNKVATKVNEMISQVNELPDMVDAAVKEQLDDGTVEAIVAEILTRDFFLNVKRPPEGVTAAKGDGATNDTTAFNEALAYAAEHDLAILIPEGDYVITSVLYNRTSSAGDPVNISILGCGSEASRLISANNNTIFKIAGGNYIRAFEMKGVGFSGGGASTSPTLALVDITASKVNLCDVSAQDAPTCFHITNCSDLNMEDIECRNYKGRGIWLQSCSHGTITNVRMDGSLTAGYNPVYMQICHDIQINDMMIDNTTGSEDICCTGANNSCYSISARWSTALTEAPYYVDPTTQNRNEWHILFKSGPWTADMETMQQEIDALPTDEDIQDLQDQIDALPTDQDVADAVAGEAALREAADTGLQEQIDALPTTTNVAEAIAAAKEAYIMERDFNVRDFGAVGDGVTDDTQAFRDCLAYMSTVRGNSYKTMLWAVVPPGKYVITDTISIPQNMGIRGTWPLVFHYGNEGSWLYIKDDHMPVSFDEYRGVEDSEYATISLQNGSSISDLGIYYPDQVAYNQETGNVKEYRYTIGFRRSNSECVIERITAINPYRFIYLGWAHDGARIRNIWGYPLRIGINDIRSDDVDIIEDVHFHRGFSRHSAASSYATRNLDCFIFKGCDWTQIHNCFAYAFRRGITLLTATETNTETHTETYQGVRHLVADTVNLEIATEACLIEADARANYGIYSNSNGHSDNKFIDCIWQGNANSDNGDFGVGVYLGYGKEYSFINCTWRCGGNTCINMDTTNSALIDELKLIGCNFMYNGHTNESGHYGVINDSAKNLIMIGCNFNTGTSDTNNNVVRAFSTAESATIIGCRFKNYAGNVIRSLASNSQFDTAYMIGNVYESCTNVNGAASVVNGIMAKGDGSSITFLDNTASQRFIAQTGSVTHKTGSVELFVDAQGRLSYYTADGTKRILSYT